MSSSAPLTLASAISAAVCPQPVKVFDCGKSSDLVGHNSFEGPTQINVNPHFPDLSMPIWEMSVSC